MGGEIPIPLRYRHRSKIARFSRHRSPGAGRHRRTKTTQGTEAIRIERTTATATSDESDFGISCCTRASPMASPASKKGDTGTQRRSGERAAFVMPDRSTHKSATLGVLRFNNGLASERLSPVRKCPKLQSPKMLAEPKRLPLGPLQFLRDDERRQGIRFCHLARGASLRHRHEPGNSAGPMRIF